MNQPPQTGKRIVSKGEYASLMIRKIALGLGSTGLAIFIACCIFSVVFLLIFGLWNATDIWRPLGCLIFAALIAFIGSIIKRLAEAGMERALKNENIILLTRANTADLPAPDSLVRASAEPVQEQQTVLLRAVTETVERHEEQLVRASAGGTE